MKIQICYKGVGIMKKNKISYETTRNNKRLNEFVEGKKGGENVDNREKRNKVRDE